MHAADSCAGCNHVIIVRLGYCTACLADKSTLINKISGTSGFIGDAFGPGFATWCHEEQSGPRGNELVNVDKEQIVSSRSFEHARADDLMELRYRANLAGQVLMSSLVALQLLWILVWENIWLGV